MDMTFFHNIKKSLRAKFTIILLLVGIIPLTGASLFFYYTAKDALFKNVFKELKWNANEMQGIIQEHFSDTGKDLVIASKNTAFTMYFLEPLNKRYWIKEQQKTLQHFRKIYPDIIDEACFIEASGQEISRIVLDEVSHEHELASDEDRSIFFKEAFLLGDGEVYQGKPTISEDTHRWVLPNATPIIVNGRKAAILHFEVNLSYFQLLLKKLINPDRGYGFILNDAGEFIAHTVLTLNDREALRPAITPETPPALVNMYKRMLAGESGIEQFSAGGQDYYAIFQPIAASYNKGRNDNKWTIAYVIPSDRVYVELAILRYNLLALGFTFLIVIILAYVIGNYITKPIRELAGATNKLAGGEMPKIEVGRADELGQLSDSFNLMVEAIKRRDEALKALAITDGLTGMYNHRYFKTELEKYVKTAQRYGRPVSLVMADIDFFKHYNDTHGHAQGDMALKKVAEVFMKNVREIDIAARYGGEEFVVILPETSLEGALKVAERLRKKVAEEIIPYEDMQPNGDVTVSIGVATFPDSAPDPAMLIEAADKELYKSKELGRNQVCPKSVE